MIAFLDLERFSRYSDMVTGRVLISVEDIESVQSRIGTNGSEYGSVIHTKSGDTHYVSKDIAEIFRLMDEAHK